MNRINFYKYVNYKILDKLKKDDNTKIMILYDFNEDYYDMKDNKVRIGIKNADTKKFKNLDGKILNIEKKIGGKFDIIDMRMSLRYGFNTKIERNRLFKFVCNHLVNGGHVIGFVNSKNDILKLLVDSDIIDKGDEKWIPDMSNNTIKVIFKTSDKEEQQFMITDTSIKNFKTKLSLNKFKEPNSKLDFSGEYIIICQK